MITTLTPLSLNQGKLYGECPDADRINEHMLRDIGFRVKVPEGICDEALPPTWRARLGRLFAWAVPLVRMDASGR